MRIEKLEHLETTGMIEGKCSRAKTARKDVGWTNKYLNVGRVTDALKLTRYDRDVRS